MKKRTLSKVASIVFICLLLSSIFMTAFALDSPLSSNQKGSINITMKSDGSVVPGGEITIYYVGTLSEDENGVYSYLPTDDFKPSEIPLVNIGNSALPQKLEDYARANKLKGISKEIDENGKVSFSNLEPGLYLAVQTNAAQGYYLSPSFLFEIPHYNSDKGQWEYDIEAIPKVEPQPLPDDTTVPQPTTTPNETLPSKPTEDELPHTGQLNWPIPLLAFGGIILFIIGWTLYYEKGKK